MEPRLGTAVVNYLGQLRESIFLLTRVPICLLDVILQRESHRKKRIDISV